MRRSMFIQLYRLHIKNLEQIKAQIIPNIAVLVVADAIYGAIIGNMLFGRRAIKHFVLVSAAASIPFGILLSMPVHIAFLSFDQKILFTLVSYGTAAGLSIGSYSLFQLK